jgi:hypothetical protein
MRRFSGFSASKDLKDTPNAARGHTVFFLGFSIADRDGSPKSLKRIGGFFDSPFPPNENGRETEHGGGGYWKNAGNAFTEVSKC